MKNSIDIPDLFNRVSDNKEFAHRMLTTFFESYKERYDQLEKDLKEEKFDELADGAHQLKGILGNLSIPEGFDLLKTVHSEARLNNSAKLVGLLKKLDKSILKAEKFFNENQEIFN